MGGDGPDGRRGQSLVAEVDFAEREVTAEADGVGALDGISVEEAAIHRDAAEAGGAVIEGDGGLDEALGVGALDAAEDVLGLPGDGATEGKILGRGRDRSRRGSRFLGVTACDEDGEGEGGEGVFHERDCRAIFPPKTKPLASPKGPPTARRKTAGPFTSTR